MRIYFLPLAKINVLYDELVKPDRETAQSNKMQAIPTWAVYIDHPEAKIIFDTGERHSLDKEFPEDGLLQQLSLCGILPEEIDYVIMSHLHNDHAGNIRLFPNASVVVQRQEFEAAMKEVQDGDPAGIYHREDLDIDIKWLLVEGRQHLLEGIDLIPFPGHTRGLQGMLLTLEKTGKILITSDACYTSINYGPPFRPAGVCVSEALSLESLEKIRALEEETHAKIIFGHDMKQFDALKKAPDFYE